MGQTQTPLKQKAKRTLYEEFTKFILTTVMMEKCSVGDALLELRRELAWKDILLTEQFHASTDRQEIRDYVFNRITGYEFRVDATVLEKRAMCKMWLDFLVAWLNLPFSARPANVGICGSY